MAAMASSAYGQTVTLPEIVVSASPVPVPAEQVGSAVTVITEEEIERKQKPFVGDLLREVPGVAVNRTGGVGSTTSVRIRGAEANHTLVVVDGIEVNDPSASSQFEFGELLTDGIARIEVLRGPQSALYGSDAIGGVIDVATVRGEGPLTVSGALEGGSFDTVRAQVRLSGGGERYHYAFTGSSLTTDGTSDASEARGNVEDDSFRNRTGHLKVGFTPIENLELELVARQSRSKDDTDSFVGGAGATDGDSETRAKRRAGRVQATYALLDGDWEHVLGAAVNDDQRDNYVAGARNSLFDGRKVRFDYQTSYRFDTSVGTDAEHTVVLMADYEEETVRSRSAFVNVNRDIEAEGYAAEYRIGLFDRLFLSAGVRFDDNELFDDQTTWRATAAYLFPSTGTRLHASAATGAKNPTIFELFGFAANFVGNPNLKPEESIGFDAGVEQTFWNGRAVADVTVFRNRIDDLITGSGNTAVNVPGKSKIDGVEASLRLLPVEPLAITATYTFTDGKDANDVQLVRRPEHMASLAADYSLTIAGRPARLGAGVEYRGEQTDVAFDAFFNRRTVTLSSYTLVRATASWELNDRVELFGRIENALDEDYEQVFTYGSPGRAAYIGVRASF